MSDSPQHTKPDSGNRSKTDTQSCSQSTKSEEGWNLVAWQVLEIFLAETVGTAMLLFFGCMGLVSWRTDVGIPPLQGAVVFAVVVATIIQIFGHISAAHLNPAVTFAFIVLGQVTPTMAIIYVFSECVGAILGYGLLLALTPEAILSITPEGLCSSVPHSGLTDLQAVGMEFFATCSLIMVVCACSDPRNADKSDSVPLKFGCTILALSICVGPYTGASLNPARSMAPALYNGNWTRHWVYWVSTCPAGFLTAMFYQKVFNRKRPNVSTTLEEVPLNIVTVNASRTDKGKDQCTR